MIDLPESEVLALRTHLDEAIADPKYVIIVNYPIENVVKVARFYGLDISHVEIHSLPGVTAKECWDFRKALDEIKAAQPCDMLDKSLLTG